MFYELIREKVTESVTFQITVTSIEFDQFTMNEEKEYDNRGISKCQLRSVLAQFGAILSFPALRIVAWRKVKEPQVLGLNCSLPLKILKLSHFKTIFQPCHFRSCRVSLLEPESKCLKML